MSEQLIRRVQDVRFTPTRMREGYDMGEVDYFLDQLCERLAAGQPVEEMIGSARFTPVKLREGYDMGEVDALLAEVRGAAAAREQPALAVPEPGDAGATEPDQESARVEQAGPAATTVVNAALVDEVRNVRFTPVRLRRGYAMKGVDALLDALVERLSAGRTVDDLVPQTLPQTRLLVEGYAIDEVDRFVRGVRERARYS